MEHGNYEVDLLDETGKVIGHKKRRDIDKLNDVYNAIYIFLITPEGRVVLTPIKERKDLPNIFVGQFGVPVATIRRTGEDAKQAAHRAVSRELFIDNAEMNLLGEEMMKYSGWHRLTTVFYLIGEPPQTFSKTDIDELVTLTPRELTKDMRENRKKYAPSLIGIWEKFQDKLPI